ncbi:MAG: hypothetical protein ACM3JI_04640, partial [Anaerolineae bacterium]
AEESWHWKSDLSLMERLRHPTTGFVGKSKDPVDPREVEYAQDVAGMMLIDRDLYFAHSIKHRTKMKKDSQTERLIFLPALQCMAGKGKKDLQTSLLVVIPRDLRDDLGDAVQSAVTSAKKIGRRIEKKKDKLKKLSNEDLIERFEKRYF